ncbi:cytochrome P450 [Clavulina sp. PMI_390]|nr:cytochrome P450 [Clavulina sp. PMI_390]
MNSYAVAFELLGRRGSTHCNRPPYPFLRRFLGMEYLPPLIDTDQNWKEERRLYQTLLNKETSHNNYAKDVALQACEYVRRVIEFGSDRENELIDQAIHKTLLQSTYGMNVEYHDPLLLLAIQTTTIASYGLLPAKHLVNSFPTLQHLPAWVPFQTWRIEGEKSRPAIDRISDVPWQHTLEAVANGTAEESFACGVIRERTPANEHLLQITSSTNLTAGAETTTGICRAFILAMLLHPEVRRKAQKEIDQVVGHDRLPCIDDQPDLPYLDALIKEVLRWRPLSPFSIPTVPSKDDIYEGYLIPRSSIVMQNSWAISRDERMYPDADLFNPDRWLVPDPPKDARLWVFGIGMAYAELVYTTIFMTLLATVDIVPAHDGEEKEIFVDPTAPTTGRVTCIPEAFSYSLRPRSDTTTALLNDTLV